MPNQPVFVHQYGGHFTLATFGGNHEPLIRAGAFLRDSDVSISHLVFPPSHTDAEGFQTIAISPSGGNINTDGILIQSGQTAGIFSRDCPIVFMYDDQLHEGVLFHCGRPAMSPRQYGIDPAYTVVTSAWNALRARGCLPNNVKVVITAGICQDCFTHNLKTDVKLLAPFLLEHLWAIDTESGGLDLVGLIQMELALRGISAEHIIHDGLCTKEHPELTSKRGGDKLSNFVTVTLS